MNEERSDQKARNHMKCIGRTMLTFFIVVVSLALGTCVPREGGTPLRVGYLPITADLPLFVAYEKGLFDKHGLTNVELVATSSSNEAIGNLVAGRTDIQGGVGLSTLYSSWLRRPGSFRLYATGYEDDENYTSSLLVPVDSPIQQPGDLVGRVVGTYSGLTQVVNLRLVLDDFLDPETDITISQVDPSLQLKALQSGQFDALFTIDPYTTMALSQGLARSLIVNPRVKYIMRPFPTFANPVSANLVENSPDTVRSFIAAYNEGLEYLNEHPGVAGELLPKYTPVSPEVANECGKYSMLFLGDQSFESLREIGRIFVANGVIDELPNIDTMYLPREFASAPP